LTVYLKRIVAILYCILLRVLGHHSNRSKRDWFPLTIEGNIIPIKTVDTEQVPDIGTDKEMMQD